MSIIVAKTEAEKEKLLKEGLTLLGGNLRCEGFSLLPLDYEKQSVFPIRSSA